MHQARKGISVCIDHVIFIEVHVPSQERMHTLITFLDRYIYVNKKCKIDTHTDHFPGLVHVLQLKGQDRYTKYMYPARKGISVCIDLALFIEVHVPSQERDQCVYRSCPFYWSTCTKPGKGSVCVLILPFLLYIYVNKKCKIDTHTDHFPGLVHVLQLKGQDRYTHWSLSWLGTCTSIKRARSMHTLITFLVWYMLPSEESDQCVYRSCPFYWSICTKPGKWSVCISILPFSLKYMYQARKVISVCIDLASFYWSTWSLSSLGTCTSIKRSR
jgi:predicted nucleic acid-binding Zn finger protein